MPTEPLEPLLNRHLSRVAGTEAIEIVCPLLQELVNHATNALARCDQSTSGNIDEDVAVLALYRHVIEMTDGIEVLIGQSSPVPAIPLLRSSFEALISIEYILEIEKEYVIRSLSWLLGWIHRQIAALEALDLSTGRGKQFQRSLEDEKLADIITLPDFREAQAHRANFESVLQRAHFRPIEAEFQACKKKDRRSPPWHRLFGGPRTIEALARHVGRPASYEFLYRSWSETAHAADFSRLLVTSDEGQHVLQRLRNPADIPQVAQFAPTFILSATQKVLGRFRSGESVSLGRWYRQEIQGRYRSVAKWGSST